jgi:hypothetical protein
MRFIRVLIATDILSKIPENSPVDSQCLRGLTFTLAVEDVLLANDSRMVARTRFSRVKRSTTCFSMPYGTELASW